jgi:hypothetical protein
MPTYLSWIRAVKAGFFHPGSSLESLKNLLRIVHLVQQIDMAKIRPNTHTYVRTRRFLSRSHSVDSDLEGKGGGSHGSTMLRAIGRPLDVSAEYSRLNSGDVACCHC